MGQGGAKSLIFKNSVAVWDPWCILENLINCLKGWNRPLDLFWAVKKS